MDLRRRRLNGGSTPPSLYGGDIDEVTFEATYLTDQSLGFAVLIIHIFFLILDFILVLNWNIVLP